LVIKTLRTVVQNRLWVFFFVFIIALWGKFTSSARFTSSACGTFSSRRRTVDYRILLKREIDITSSAKITSSACGTFSSRRREMN